MERRKELEDDEFLNFDYESDEEEAEII